MLQKSLLTFLRKSELQGTGIFVSWGTSITVKVTGKALWMTRKVKVSKLNVTHYAGKEKVV